MTTKQRDYALDRIHTSTWGEVIYVSDLVTVYDNSAKETHIYRVNHRRNSEQDFCEWAEDHYDADLTGEWPDLETHQRNHDEVKP